MNMYLVISVEYFMKSSKIPKNLPREILETLFDLSIWSCSVLFCKKEKNGKIGVKGLVKRIIEHNGRKKEENSIDLE